MADCAEHFLVCQETDKSRGPIFTRWLGGLDRTAFEPLEAFGQRKHGLHELVLVANRDINVTDPHTGTQSDVCIGISTFDCLPRIVVRREFNEAISGLPGRTLHHDVDGPLLGQPSITTKELDHLLAGHGVGDLCLVEVSMHIKHQTLKDNDKKNRAYTLDSHDPRASGGLLVGITANGDFWVIQDALELLVLEDQHGSIMLILVDRAGWKVIHRVC